MIKYLLILLIPLPAYANTAHIPVSVVITTPLHEMDYQEAVDLCLKDYIDYCEDIIEPDGTPVFEVQSEDGFTVFELVESNTPIK